jgi:hypothetical protein
VEACLPPVSDGGLRWVWQDLEASLDRMARSVPRHHIIFHKYFHVHFCTPVILRHSVNFMTPRRLLPFRLTKEPFALAIYLDSVPAYIGLELGQRTSYTSLQPERDTGRDLPPLEADASRVWVWEAEEPEIGRNALMYRERLLVAEGIRHSPSLQLASGPQDADMVW